MLKHLHAFRRVRFVLALIATVFILAPRPAAHAGFVTGDFEDVNPGPDTVQNDFPSGSFMTGGFTLNNNFDPNFNAWSGFSVSTMVDNTFVKGDNDFDHQYGAYAPTVNGLTGSGGSATYGLAFNFSQGDAIINMPTGVNPYSIDITNTTYVADAITNGDQFTSGPFHQGDFFRLDILGFSQANGGGTLIGDVPVYLADFRGSSLILISNWTTVDLSSLAGAASLEFTMTSTDTGIFGTNTPTFFALDNIVGVTAVPEPSTVVLFAIGLVGMSLFPRHVRRRRCAG
jgi:Domain of unknown function (DUF4465)/PEP-CTERM motif